MRNQWQSGKQIQARIQSYPIQQTTERIELDEKPKETRAEKFIRMIDKRMANALFALDQVENIFDTNNYSFTADQATKVIIALRKRISELEGVALKEKQPKKGFSILD